MLKHFLLLLSIFSFFLSLKAQEPYYRDIYPDTWVATDVLGRTMPGIGEV
jgi:hypothetical protein